MKRGLVHFACGWEWVALSNSENVSSGTVALMFAESKCRVEMCKHSGENASGEKRLRGLDRVTACIFNRQRLEAEHLVGPSTISTTFPIP